MNRGDVSGNNRGWYWTLDRLKRLKQLLDKAAQQDDKGHYFGGSLALSNYVLDNARKAGLEGLTRGRVKTGIEIFRFLGGIDEGKPGVGLATDKRGYYPEKLQSITPSDINRYRRALGVKGPLPPPR
jgi:hypothetical protein